MVNPGQGLSQDQGQGFDSDSRNAYIARIRDELKNCIVVLEKPKKHLLLKGLNETQKDAKSQNPLPS